MIHHGLEIAPFQLLVLPIEVVLAWLRISRNKPNHQYAECYKKMKKKKIDTCNSSLPHFFMEIKFKKRYQCRSHLNLVCIIQHQFPQRQVNSIIKKYGNGHNQPDRSMDKSPPLAHQHSNKACYRLWLSPPRHQSEYLSFYLQE